MTSQIEDGEVTFECACGCGGAVGRKARYRVGHHGRKSPVNYIVDPVTGCWVWQLSIKANGYGTIKVNQRMWNAHRYYYTQARGAIPAGLTIDHLCRNRACVNPDHLEPVTMKEQGLRGKRASQTHCKYGHEFTPANTYWHIRGGGHWVSRSCRTCGRERYRGKVYAMLYEQHMT